MTHLHLHLPAARVPPACRRVLAPALACRRGTYDMACPPLLAPTPPCSVGPHLSLSPALPAGDRFPQYDLGLHGNLASVLGRERWTWLIPMYLRGPDGDGVHWPTRDGGRVGTATSLADEAQAHSQTASASHVHPGIRELSPRGELDPAQCSLPAGHSLGNLPATASQVSATSSTSR